MRLDNQRRSDNFEDRGGRRGGGGGGGGIPMRLGNLSFGTIVIIGIALLAVNFFAPPAIKDAIFGQLFGSQGGSSGLAAGDPVCTAKAQECDEAKAVLGATEDVWITQFESGRLPVYQGATRPAAYEPPTLVVFSGQVDTGCGTASAAVGPFYCPPDRQLYIDLSFYDVLRERLRAGGDFAQAYVIAHEVAHHVQNLIGATQIRVSDDTQNQTSVRLELQADCFAGVWGHNKQADLVIDDADLDEALGAAHAIGDDTLQRGSTGFVRPDQFTHGTSEQRMRWFRTGFDSGDARRCDTFAVTDYNRL
jgi:uncharacterized protein